MDDLINQLAEILDQEARVYDGILKLSKSKTNIIVEGKITELENVVKLEQSLVLQMGRLEDMREKLVDKLAGLLGIKSKDITVSEILKNISNQQAQKLKVCQEKMATVVGDLRNTNELNSKLIKNSLDYINFSLNIFTTVDTGNNNYGSTGQVGDSKKRSMFDMRF